MKTLGIFIMALFMGLSATFGQTTLSGKVFSKKDGKPLAGAVVSVKEGATASTTTDANGMFKFTVPAGAKILTVTVPGYKAKTEGIGQKTVFNFEMMVDPKGSKGKGGKTDEAKPATTSTTNGGVSGKGDGSPAVKEDTKPAVTGSGKVDKSQKSKTVTPVEGKKK